MDDSGIDDAVLRRLSEVGCASSVDEVRRLSLFLRILGKWNSRLNLTALQVEPPGDETIDRLIVEPSLAARLLHEDERFVVDVGSGSGSPGLPLYVKSGRIAVALIESRSRKAAFLREAAREIQGAGVTVEICRVEELSTQAGWTGRADVVTMRGVRPDKRVLEAIVGILRPLGRLFYFHSADHVEHEMFGKSSLVLVDTVPLVASNRSVLSIFLRPVN